MHLKIPIIAIASLAVGVLIGRHLPGATPAMSAADAAPVLESRPSRSKLGSIHPPIAGGNGHRKTSENPDGTSTSANSAGNVAMVPVSINLVSSMSLAAGHRKLDQDLFSGDGAVEEALQINDHEKALIQTAWRASLGEIRKLEVDVIHSEAIDEWSHRIVVPETGGSTTPLANRFRSTVLSALGSERGELFLAAKQVERMLQKPSAERIYTVTTEEVGDGKWRFRIELNGEDGQRMWVGDKVPDEILHLTNAAGITSTLEE